MSVKVVQGLIGEVKTPVSKAPSANPQQNLVTQQAAVSLAARSITQTIATNEAVSVSLRSSSSPGKAEKIKDFKEAKEVSENVAERIKSDDSAKDAHSGLSSTSGANLV